MNHSFEELSRSDKFIKSLTIDENTQNNHDNVSSNSALNGEMNTLVDKNNSLQPKINDIHKNLIDAVRNGDLDKVKDLIAIYNANAIIHISNEGIKIDDLNLIKDENGWTLLHFAAQGNNEEVVECLLKAGVNPTIQNKAGETALHFAACNGNEKVIECLLKAGADVNVQGIDKWTPLHYATQGHNEKVVEYLLKAGADPTIQDKNGKTAFMVDKNNFLQPKIDDIHKNLIDAVINGNLDKVKDFIKIYDLYEIKSEGRNLLGIASYEGDLNIIKYLVEKGNFPIDKESDVNNETALHVAANNENTNEKVVEYLLDKGANVNAQNGHKWTPLHFAAYNGNEKVVEYLLKAGANPIMQNEEGETAFKLDKNNFLQPKINDIHKNLIDAVINVDLDKVKDSIKIYDLDEIMDKSSRNLLNIASSKGHLEIVKYLVEEGNLPINSRSNANDETALHSASYYNHKDIMEYLVEKGANPTIQDKNGKIAFMLDENDFLQPKIKEIHENLLDAATNGNLDTIKDLIKIYDLYQIKDEGSRNLLNIASWKNNLDIIKCLVEKGNFPVNIRSNASDETALHSASYYNHKEIMEYLLKKGANPTIQDKNGDTAFALDKNNFLQTKIKEIHKNLIGAATNGDLDTIKDSIKIYDLCEIKGERGWTLLHYAAQGNEEIVEYLLENGANVDAKDRYGETPLHFASRYGQEKIVECLLDKGANIEAKDTYGKTPLHFAVQYDNEKVVEYLLEKGANVNAQNIDKWTPLHSASYFNHKEIVEYLLEKGANVNAQNIYKWTPLHSAAQGDYKEVVELLLKAGANPTIQNTYGKTPLDLAKSQEIRTLLQKAQENPRNEEDNSNEAQSLTEGDVNSDVAASQHNRQEAVERFVRSVDNKFDIKNEDDVNHDEYISSEVADNYNQFDSHLI